MEAFLAAFSALFSVVNPFGAVPIFLLLTKDQTSRETNYIALRTAIYMVLILITFFLAGKFILDFFGIRIEDIRIAGGIMISISGFNLLRTDAYKGKPLAKEIKKEGLEKEDISFTPMAMPLLSGPGSIALIIGMFDSAKGKGYLEYLYMILAIISVSLISFVILRFSKKLDKFLGKSGMGALSKIMGFIVMSIGVGMILNGLLPLIKG